VIPTVVQREVLRTPRLRLRWFEPGLLGDQRFVLRLLNDPDWISHIGKRDVSTCEQAEAYLRDGARAMCERLGFGLFLVERLADGASIGMCGLIKRDGLADVDLGYAFLPEGRGHGFAREAATAVRDWAHHRLGLRRIVAIVTPANTRSVALLGAISFGDEGEVRLAPGDGPLRLMAWSASAA
jgi:RimJ/RimL family protein N-acetyltransferase